MKFESLQSRRTWIVGGVVIALLMAVASWSLVISPKLTSTSTTRAQTADNDLANNRLIARHGTLLQDERNVGSLRSKLAAALTALPATSALPEFTHEATAAATTTAVALQNINIGTLSPVTSTAAPTPAASTAPASESESATTSPAAGSPSTASIYQAGITLTTSGPIKNQLAFIRAIQNGPRRALLSSSAFSGLGNNVTLTTQLNIFTAPMTTQQLAQLRKLLAG